jgi:hypothetical protein
MIRDRVQETTSSTGAGNLTLLGAIANYISFDTAFGSDHRFIYWIVDNTNNVWETGVGYLQNATTLIRERVHDNSSDTTSPLDLEVGLKAVFCAPNAATEFASTYQCHDHALREWVFGIGNTEPSTYFFAQEVPYFFPFYLTIGGLYSGIGLEVTAASTLGSMNTGIYSLVSGRPDKRLAETGSFSTTTTGVKSNSFSGGNILLSPGWYYTALIEDVLAGATLRACQSDSISGNAPMGHSSANLSARGSGLRGASGSGTTLPDPAPTTHAEENANIPYLGLINVT